MDPTPARRRNQRRKHTRTDDPASIEMPRLGLWLQQVRTDRGLSQRELAVRTNISEPYIPKIEAGLRPSREVLNQLTTALSLNPMQTRHAIDLWGPALPLPSIDELRERITTRRRMTKLAHLDESGVISVYTDPFWNILAANTSFYRALPGLDEARNNVALWFFRMQNNLRPAAQVALQWQHEAEFHVAILRGAFGLYRDSPRARDLFERLRRDKGFAQLWKHEVSVAYSRHEDDLALLRDSASGEPYSIAIDIHEVADAREIRVCHAVRCDHPRLSRTAQR